MTEAPFRLQSGVTLDFYGGPHGADFHFVAPSIGQLRGCPQRVGAGRRVRRRQLRDQSFEPRHQFIVDNRGLSDFEFHCLDGIRTGYTCTFACSCWVVLMAQTFTSWLLQLGNSGAARNAAAACAQRRAAEARAAAMMQRFSQQKSVPNQSRRVTPTSAA